MEPDCRFCICSGGGGGGAVACAMGTLLFRLSSSAFILATLPGTPTASGRYTLLWAGMTCLWAGGGTLIWFSLRPSGESLVAEKEGGGGGGDGESGDLDLTMELLLFSSFFMSRLSGLSQR